MHLMQKQENIQQILYLLQAKLTKCTCYFSLQYLQTRWRVLNQLLHISTVETNAVMFSPCKHTKTALEILLVRDNQMLVLVICGTT